MENSCSALLTRREIEVVEKKLKNKPLSSSDSNVLSRFVRPKLKKISNMNAKALLDRLNYNPKSITTESKIIRLIRENIKHVDAIIIIGSAIQTGYKYYNDIDIIVLTKNRYWKSKWENLKLCLNVQNKAKIKGLNLDIQIISKQAFISSYPKNPGLIYQLKDHKVIYGKIKIPDKINLSKHDLMTKLDWSDIKGLSSKPEEIYNAIRNALLVRLLAKKIIDNSILREELIKELGNELALKLKSNKVIDVEKRYAIHYLNELIKKTEWEIKNVKT